MTRTSLLEFSVGPVRNCSARSEVPTTGKNKPSSVTNSMLVVGPLKAIVADNGCSWLPPVRRERKFPLLGDTSAPSRAQAQSRIDSGEPLIPYRCRDGVAARANGERRRGNAVRRLGVNAATAPATVSGKSAPNATDGLVFRDPREGRRGRPSRESGD